MDLLSGIIISEIIINYNPGSKIFYSFTMLHKPGDAFLSGLTVQNSGKMHRRTG